jgi:hypothetical protein
MITRKRAANAEIEITDHDVRDTSLCHRFALRC